MNPKSHIEELKELSPLTLKTAITNITNMVRSTSRYSRTPLWSIVGTAFGCGSTSAHDLCVKSGLRPDQIINRRSGLKPLIPIVKP